MAPNSLQISSLLNPTTMAGSRITLLKDAYEKCYGSKNEAKDMVLVGEAGFGKTLIARMLSDHAIEKEKFHVAIWVYIKPDDAFCDKNKLHHLVKRQLHMLYMSEKLESEGDKEGEKEKNGKEDQPSEASDIKAENGGNKEENQQRPVANDANVEKGKAEEQKNSEGDKNVAKKKIYEEKEKKEEEDRDKILKERKALFVFDGDALVSVIKEVLKGINCSSSNFLLTTMVDPSADMPPPQDVLIIKLEDLTDEDLKHCSERIFERPEKLKEIRDHFYNGIQFLPSDIMILEKVCDHLNGSDEELKKFKLGIEEMPQPENGRNKSMQLLYKGYDKLPRNVLIDYCPSENVFLKQGALHFNELIAYWVLEGFLGDFDRIEDAYKKGHSVMLDLLDCGLLTEIGYGYVAANEAKLTLDPIDHCDFYRRIHLGLGTVFDSQFYRMVESKGRMKTLCDGIEPDKKSPLALIVDANRLDREIHIDYEKLNEHLEIFAYFDPTDEHLPSILFKKSKVRLFVMRGGSYIKSAFKDASSSDLSKSKEKLSVKQMQPRSSPVKAINTTPSSPPSPTDTFLSHLTVLEISGASFLNKIPDSLFSNMPNAKSLNLSGLGISSLPPSVYTLEKLVVLILRNCSKLKELGTLRHFKDLKVLDLSGAKAFSHFHDKSFTENKELRTLNLSGTNLTKMPLLRDLTKLNHLLLKDCVQLKRLPKISALSSLEILDLSGSKIFEEFHDASLELLDKLKLVDLSRTAVKKLPLNFANPQLLYLNGCQRLERLSFIKSMEKLSVLDISDCRKLNDIYQPFFVKLSALQNVNLSATDVKTIPSFSEFTNLRKLKVCNCHSLDKLEGLESLESLVSLDLSDSKDLKEMNSLVNLLKLEELNLSNTQISSLPSFSDNGILQTLTLKDCIKLTSVNSLKVLSKLEKLDLSGSVSLTVMEDNLLENLTQLGDLNLSGTSLQKSPCLSMLKSLHILCFRNCKDLSECPGLDTLTQLQQLDLSGSAIKVLAFEKFSNLKYLGLENCPNMDKFHVDEFSKPGSDGFLFKGSSFSKLKLLEPPLKEQVQQSNEGSTSGIKPSDSNQWRVSCWFPDKALRIAMGTSQFLGLMMNKESMFREKLHEFHVALHPAAEEATYGDEHIRKNELRFRETYTAAILKGSNQGVIHGSLEISGKLNCLPVGCTSAIHQSKRIFLTSVSSPNDIIPLVTENIKEMEVFWVEECNKLEAKDQSTSNKKGKAGESEVQKNDASSSDSDVIFSNIIRDSSFGNLKFMYLENCQTLNYIGSSSDFLSNLEILQIKNCKALKKLFKEGATLPKLKRLQLWDIPELDEISCKMPSLNTLDVGECPGLKNVFPSASPVGNIEVLRVRFCTGLEKICVDEEPKLSKLKTLHLWSLPELVSIGQNVAKRQGCYIRGCPKLIQKL
ncbi:hypothetical protein Leryth_016220 [Lithospermum erythrorhizon]|nr:hypothetical protein Leryth_016220 [Lithospermum erythrorhizon]